MRRSPSIAPAQPDVVDVYLVLDDFGGRLGRAWRETDEGSTDRRTLITDLLDGQYSNPARIVAFNTAEGWSRDVSEELAEEIAKRCAAEGFDVPPFLESFVDLHSSGRPVQLPLPLRGSVVLRP
jgi:hypothetical protein